MTKHQAQAVERSIVLQLLRGVDPCTVGDLEAAQEVETLALRHAIGELAGHDVAVVEGERVEPSACVRHLDKLDLIAVEG
jgi:hypothetical protein